MIKTYAVNSEIPLLLSKYAMKKAKIKLDLETNNCEIFGENVILVNTTNDHYYIQ